METSRLIEVETKIRAAVAEAKANGWIIIQDAYYGPPNMCCVLGACITNEIEDASVRAEVPLRASRILGIAPATAAYIAIGFDGKNHWAEQHEMYQLGARLRDLVDK